MRHPQVIVYEKDARLAAQLHPVVERHRWALRQAQRTQGVLEGLRHANRTVLVVRLGRDLERELMLVERATWLYPDAAVIVVAEEEHAPLAELAWDLGAASVLVFPKSLELLSDVVVSLMDDAHRPA